MIRPLVYLGDKSLRTKCEEIAEITPAISELAADLTETMNAHHGAGLAAPQIGVLKRIFVICYVGTDEAGDPLIGEPIVFINPKISKISETPTVVETEGCLSIPGIQGEVARPEKIHIAYTDLQGKHIEETASGWRARAILHENDHINGVLFIDRMKRGARQKLKHKLSLIEKKYSET